MSPVAVRSRDVDAASNNLPRHLTSFVGREADLRSLKNQLHTARIVTLIGTGGAGKTRLAAELARSVPDLWPDGAWWIELEAAKNVAGAVVGILRSEEHTSELQSQSNLVCRLLLEKKKK